MNIDTVGVYGWKWMVVAFALHGMAYPGMAVAMALTITLEAMKFELH
jgi:hypothetical protein